MAALDFPASPSVGASYTSAGVTWTYDGVKWTAGPGAALLPLSGGQMTGALYPRSPQTDPNEAVSKSYVDANSSGFTSKIRNGGFDVWQRGASVAAAASTAPYTADGWMVAPSGATATVQRVATTSTAPIGSGASVMLIAGAAGMTALQLIQRIESYVSAALAGQTCTISFWMASTVAQTPQLQIVYPNAADTWPANTNVVGPVNLQPVPANTWTRLAYTFAMPMGAQNGLQVAVIFGALGAGSNTYIGAVDLRATPGLPTGLNANPPPPELRPIGVELPMCQRYFWDSQGAGGASPAAIICAGYSPAAGGVNTMGIRLPTNMRATPSAAVIRNQSYTNATAIALAVAGNSVLIPSVTVSAAGLFLANCNAQLSAEL